MHVLHLETGRHVYGGARQALLLSGGLVARGVACTLACTAGSEVALEARRQGLDVREVPMRGDLDLGFPGRFVRLVRETGPDLVHVHSRRGADWLGGRAARRAGVPALLTRRVDRPEAAWLASWKYRPYARVVAISSAIHAQLEHAGLPPARLALVRSAVEPQPGAAGSARERLVARYGLDSRALLVGCIAQFIPRKGHETLLQAWREVQAAQPAARLLLFGQGPGEGALRRQADAAGLSGSVVFAGFRADLGAVLGALDLVVHPATAEGLGLAVLEAQAAGVPVVACRAGGLPEILVDGATGLLLPAGEPRALAAALTALLADPARRRDMGRAGRERVAREFTLAGMVERYLTLYGQVTETAAL